jgi:hypothetical protein
MIDLCLTPFSLVTAQQQQQQQSTTAREKRVKKEKTNYPLQVQVKLLIPSMQMPPLRQTDGSRQSLTLSAHLGPLNPAGQRQRISPFDW